MLQELDHPRMVDRVEEAFDVGVQNPVHAIAGQGQTECVERLVTAPTRPEAIAEPEKILFVDDWSTRPAGQPASPTVKNCTFPKSPTLRKSSSFPAWPRKDANCATF